MNDSKLTRELKEIIYYIRKYGIDRINKSFEQLQADQRLMSQFFIQVHKGFYIAQEKSLRLLTKILKEQKRIKSDLAESRRQHNKDQTSLLLAAQSKVKFQECVVRKCMDAIAWQLFNYELSTLRRLFCNEEPIDITDSNIESEIAYISSFQHSSPEGFALISDLTSFVQIGDIVTLTPTDGIRLVELKDGTINYEVFQLIDESFKTQSLGYLQSRLCNENESFVKHFKRTVKQLAKESSVCNTINKGHGIDQASGLNVHIMEPDFCVDTFSTVMHDLSLECQKKGYSFAAIQECLIIGVYDIRRFPSVVFEYWMKSLDIQDPAFDYRHSFHDPLGYPMYLHPFSETFITDVVSGHIVVKMAVDTKQLIKLLESLGCTVRQMSKKETARMKGKSKASNTLYELNGQGFEIEKDGAKIYLGQGVLSKMFTGFFTPQSICQELLATLKAVKELPMSES